MEVNRLIHDPLFSYIYLERFVNMGSPSGFTYNTRLPKKYLSYSSSESFDLPFYKTRKINVTAIGLEDDITIFPNISKENIYIPIHPYIKKHASNIRPDIFKGSPAFHLKVVPTASQRTVFIKQTSLEKTPHFIKLHLPIIVGRFNRSLTLYKWISSIEASKIFRTNITTLPNYITFFDDFYSFYCESHNRKSGFATIFRNFPNCFFRNNNFIEIPCFSMFSTDSLNPTHNTLLGQIMTVNKMSLDGFLREIIEPIIYSFRDLAINFGIIPECNAQNIVFQLFKNGSVSKIAIRDMSSVWKDITIMKHNGYDYKYSPYHTIAIERDSDYYKRRSFLYDFKLGEYILLPLCKIASASLNIPISLVTDLVKKIGQDAWSKNLEYFSPYNKWYSYPNKLKVSRKGYIENENPKFR